MKPVFRGNYAHNPASCFDSPSSRHAPTNPASKSAACVFCVGERAMIRLEDTSSEVHCSLHQHPASSTHLDLPSVKGFPAPCVFSTISLPLPSILPSLHDTHTHPDPNTPWAVYSKASLKLSNEPKSFSICTISSGSGLPPPDGLWEI